ncbi:MAG TPA: PAS domain S-box protein, partial [Methylomirabilota bacterium]|nr:PAS domain S-box protein [Methylomirabilota bacterium]
MSRRPGDVVTWFLRNRTSLAFSLAAGLVLAIVIIALGARSLAEQYQTVRQTDQVLGELDGLLSAVIDAEAGQRGFLMTGDERYLTPSLAAFDTAAGHLEALRNLTAGHTSQRRHVDALEPLVRDKLGELRDTVQLGRERRADVAVQRILTGRGLRLMEQIRSTVAAMQAEERQIQAGQSTRYTRQARHVFLGLAALAAVTLGLLVVVLVEYRRRAGEIRATRSALRSQVAEYQQTSALLASIVQSSDDAIIGLGLDGRVLTWNAGAEQLYAYREEEVTGRPIDILSPDRHKDEVSASLSRVLRERAVERIETEQITGHGRRLDVFMTISPIRDAANEVVGASIVARDITARKVAEEVLRRTEATSRALLESVTESIVVTDAAGRIVLVNARTEAMFGYARAELIGQPVEALLPASLRDRHVTHRATYMAAPRIRSMGRGLDLAALKKDGTEFPVEVSLSYVETDEGVRAIAFVTDISERVAFQKAARQADKLAALGTLSAGIAHEINNPIGIITSRVEVMMLEADEEGFPDELRKDLEVILRHARRVATITQGLLSFARQSSGTRGPVNLNQVTEEIVQLARKDMSRAQVQVTTKLDEPMPTIVADANAIGQVLLNLLTNAAGAIVRVNDKAEKMFGYGRAELIGQPVEVLIPRRAREAHVAHRAGYMAAPRVRSMGRGLDLAGVKKDGTEFPVEVSLSFVETDDGIRAIAFVTDISERLAFQRAARQADKLA